MAHNRDPADVFVTDFETTAWKLSCYNLLLIDLLDLIFFMSFVPEAPRKLLSLEKGCRTHLGRMWSTAREDDGCQGPCPSHIKHEMMLASVGYTLEIERTHTVPTMMGIGKGNSLVKCPVCMWLVNESWPDCKTVAISWSCILKIWFIHNCWLCLHFYSLTKE